MIAHNEALFGSEPPPSAAASSGISRLLARRAGVAALVGWLPLLVLAAADQGLGRSRPASALFRDMGVHCQCLLAAPLLIWAPAITCPRLAATAWHFVESGLVAESDRLRFERWMESTRRLGSHVAPRIVAALFAYLSVLLMWWSLPRLPVWHLGSWYSLSLAGWWRLTVSLPLLLVAIYTWLWRLLLWGRLLFLLSRLQLRLIPAHPDRAAGLRFVGHAIAAFSPVGFALGVIVAGTLANRPLSAETMFDGYRNAALGLTATALFLFGGPTLAFTTQLMRARRRGVFAYSSLADGAGWHFESKWLDHGVDRAALESQNFSAMVDLADVVAKVYEMTLLVADLRSAIVLGVATLLPLLAAALFQVPLDVVLRTVRGLIF
jgi:hypothetical protein